MKHLLLFFFMLSWVLFVAFGKVTFANAQTATDSAVTPTLITLPTLFPTVTPPVSSESAFPILQQLDKLATPETKIEISTQSAEQVASGSAQDYCLNVPIVMYHHVEPIDIATQLGHPQLTVDSTFFEEHISQLVKDKYHFLSLGDLVYAILTRGTVPDKSIVITLDDGYIDNYTYAFLIAKKYHVIMNYMIPTGLVGKPDYLTWDHLKEMTASPYTRIYSHTTTHAPLGLIDQDQIINETTTANQQLKTNLGKKVRDLFFKF